MQVRANQFLASFNKSLVKYNDNNFDIKCSVFNVSGQETLGCLDNFISQSRKRSPQASNPHKEHIIEIIMKEMPSIFCKLKLFLLNYGPYFLDVCSQNKLILLARRKKRDASVSNILDT